MKKIFVETIQAGKQWSFDQELFFFIGQFFLYLDLGATYQLQMENCEYEMGYRTPVDYPLVN